MDRFDDYKTHSIYSEICYQAYGKKGEKFFDIVTNITLFGIGIVYTLTASEMIAKLPWDKAGMPLLSNQKFCVLIVTLILVPVILLRDMTSLSFASLLGNIAIISCVIIVIVYGLIYNEKSVMMEDVKWVETSISGLSKLYGTLLFSFGVVFVTLPTIDEMQTPSSFNTILSITTTSSAIFYSVCNSFMYILYHNVIGGVKSNILQNMDNSSYFYYASTVLICLMSIFSYPVTVMPALQLCEPKANDNDKGLFTKTPKKIIFRLVILFLVSSLGLLFPNFNIVVSLLGNITITLITFILPPLLYLRLNEKNTKKEKIINGIFITLGIISMIFTTTNTILSIL